MYTVIMESTEYGAESFEYETIEEAEAGIKRLAKSAKKHKKEDGIERYIYLLID